MDNILNKRSFVNVASQILVFLMNIAISFFLTPFLVKTLGSAAYGYYSLGKNFISYIHVFTAALNSMAARFITIEIYKNEHEKVNKYFSSLVIANLGISIILSVLFGIFIINVKDIFVIGEELLSDVILLWALLFLDCIINLIFSVFGISFIARNRFDISNFKTMISYLIRTFILLIFYIFLTPRLWYLSLATLLCSLYLVYNNIKYTKILLPDVKLTKKHFDLSCIKELFFSGIWNSVSKLANILNNELDVLITNFYVGPNMMGVVSISKTLPAYLLSLFSMMTNLFVPKLTEEYIQYGKEKMKDTLISLINVFSFFSVFPLVFLFCFGNSFYQLWQPNIDTDLLYMLTIIGCIEFPVALALEPLWNTFTILNKVKVTSKYVLIKGIIGIFLTLIFLQFSSGKEQSAYLICGVSSLLDLVSVFTFLPIYGAKCLEIKWSSFYPVISKNLLKNGLVLFICFYLNRIFIVDGWVSLLSIFCIAMLIALLISYLFLNVEEKTFLKDGIRKVKNKL